MPTTRAQQVLARFRKEQDAFRIVIDLLVEWKKGDLVPGVVRIFRARVRMLRRLAGALLDDAEGSHATEELRRLAATGRRIDARLHPKRTS